jgi:hypothetical protein
MEIMRKEKETLIHDSSYVLDEAGTAQKNVATVTGANNIAWLGSKDKELLLCSCDDGTLQVSFIYSFPLTLFSGIVFL